MDEHVKLVTLDSQNKEAFLEAIRVELYAKFKVTRDEDLPENLSNLKPWSLLRMIDEDILDIYQLVYVENKFWGSSGGIVRILEDGRKVYQAGFRTFSRSHENVHKGLGTKPYISALCVRFQIERARILDCDKVILSFNEKNKRLFQLVSRYHHKRSLMGVNELMKDFVPRNEPVLFNGVLQWLLEMNLK